MAAHRVSDTRVTGANYEAHYPLIRGQFVKQIKAVCDIDCQNNQHSFQLLFFYWNLQRKVFCQPTNFVEHVSSYQESSGNWGCRVPGALYQVPRAESHKQEDNECPGIPQLPATTSSKMHFTCHVSEK